MKIKKIALKIIEKHFGSSIANSYEEFYSDKKDSTIKASVKELLKEYLGQKQAKNQFDKYFS